MQPSRGAKRHMARIRREFQSFGWHSGEYDNNSGICGIEYYVAGKDPYRVVSADRFAVPAFYPYGHDRPAPKTVALLEDLKPLLMKTLRESGIVPKLVVPRNQPNGRETLLFLVEQTDPIGWIETATWMQNLVDAEREASSINYPINVEICNDKLRYSDISTAIMPKSSSHRACMRVEEVMLKAARDLFPTLTSVSWLMRHKLGNRRNCQPTMLITVAPGTRDQWSVKEDELWRLLSSFGVIEEDLAIEIFPGGPQPCLTENMNTFHIDNPRDRLPDNGAAINARGCKEAGKLCLFVEWRPIDKSKPCRKMILTAYQVVAPGGGRNQAKNDRYGIGLNGSHPGSHIIVDCPSAWEASNPQEDLCKVNREDPNPKAWEQSTIDGMRYFEGDGRLGHVRFASGLHQTDAHGRRMDWALVELRDPNKHFLKNRLPGSDGDNPIQSTHSRYDCHSEDAINSTSGILGGDRILKAHGNSSRRTAGNVNAMQATLFHEGFESKEMQFCDDRGSRVLCPGDSGALVVGKRQVWSGMVTGVHGSAGFITPADSIMQHIKDTTGGEIFLS